MHGILSLHESDIGFKRGTKLLFSFSFRIMMQMYWICRFVTWGNWIHLFQNVIFNAHEYYAKVPVTQHLNVIHGPLSFTENLCWITFRGLVQKTKFASFEVMFFLATSLNTLRGKKDQKWKGTLSATHLQGAKNIGLEKKWAKKTHLPGVLRAAATPKGRLATSSSTVHCCATACATRSKPFTRSGLAEIFQWPSARSLEVVQGGPQYSQCG